MNHPTPLPPPAVTDSTAQPLSAFALGLLKQMAAGDHQGSQADLPERITRSLADPARMECDVYLALQAQAEQLDLAQAQGQDCSDGFDQERAEVSRLMEAAPWALHPDHGCVLASEVERLDRLEQAPAP